MSALTDDQLRDITLRLPWDTIANLIKDLIDRGVAVTNGSDQVEIARHIGAAWLATHNHRMTLAKQINERRDRIDRLRKALADEEIALGTLSGELVQWDRVVEKTRGVLDDYSLDEGRPASIGDIVLSDDHDLWQLIPWRNDDHRQFFGEEWDWLGMDDEDRYGI